MSGTKVITGEVRLSFPHLFEPFAFDSTQEEKYSVMLLVPKSDSATVKALRAAEEAALAAGLPTKFKGKKPRELASIIKDGDEDGSAEDYPEREGHLYMTVSCKPQYRPSVVDQGVRPIVDPAAIYSGCYARVSINAFAYKVGNKSGISFGLNHVQKMRDGEPLDGRSLAEDDFDEVNSDEGERSLI